MRAIVLILFLVLTGCYTTSDIFQKEDRSNMTLFVSKHYGDYEKRHLEQVLLVFEKHGFEFTDAKAKARYVLDYSISAGAFVTVRVGLMRDGRQVLKASSTNTGWGHPDSTTSGLNTHLSQTR